MFIGYLIVSIALAFFLSKKTKNIWVSFLLLFWILAQPVAQYQFIVTVPGMPFELQANRILLLLLLFTILVQLHNNNFRIKKQRMYLFEKAMILLFFVVTISVVYNYSKIPLKLVIAVPLEFLLFIVLYFFSKKNINKKLLLKIFMAIVIISIISSVVSIYQFFIDSEFFRVDPSQIRNAYSNKIRSTGIFQNEYQQGYFQIFSVFVVLSLTISNKKKSIIIFLSFCSIILTFHRMDFIIFFLISILFILIYVKSSRLVYVFVFFGMLTPIIMSFIVFEYENIMKTDIFVERLSHDTMTGRFEQYSTAIETMFDHGVGVGDYLNPDYINLMFKKGLYIASYEKGTMIPLVVHNGYLAMGTKFGVIGMIVFMAFMFSMLKYSFKNINKNNKITFLPFTIIFIWFLSNITNGIIEFRIYFILLVAIILGSSFHKENLYSYNR